MKEDKLQVFLEGVQKYFNQVMDPEELVVGTPIWLKTASLLQKTLLV